VALADSPLDIQIRGTPVVDAEVVAPAGKPCEACGTPVEPLDKFCPACGRTNPDFLPPLAIRPVESHGGDSRSELPTLPPSPLSKFIKCQQCGAEIATDPNQRSYVCPFCDSTYVVEFSPQQSGRQPPEFIIGFAVTPEQAQEAFKKWLGDNTWFRPGDLATASILDKMKGIYLPFWAFTMLAESHSQLQVG
jgi:Zn finger protein HypA/HybF involved in hydrogenase expression